MDPVIRIVNRANQRGGRMLSVVDLLEAGTLSEGQLAWLLGRVLAGSSWLVGARPGGAGKTTVMCALLAMLPGGTDLRLVGPGWAEAPSEPRRPERTTGAAARPCLVAYEISPGYYEGYVWGADVRRLTQAGLEDRRIVANLHADTLEEAREQVVEHCGASEEGLGAFGVFVPLRLAGNGPRRVPVVPRFHVWEAGRWRTVERQDLADPGRDRVIGGFLREISARGLRRVEEVRAAWLSWCAKSARFS